ncbi:hypothetical protein [Flagellimonas allohymeniacidonis]|uniref:Uncharacterized protein n=1 Tax=Flagellimonas allohymeniacidonis TaxID=2517819 RepID=A0A4Q8QHH6_9FLAO|nr:hypothetical protein [Allomuricauda hymeniacidonis]TAI49227.1 hypothetical protein EW142_05365 [Allomuricauda hymeniacidonis]
MKTLSSWLILALLILTFTYPAYGQEKTTQMFWVHEDRVRPSMLMDYESSAKTLVDNCQKHGVETLSWITTSTDDFRYLYVSPINSMADISFEGFGPLREKMGAEAFDKMFADMDKCYTSHGDYVLTLDTELSYMPEGITQTPEGEDYRRFYYLKTTPEHVSAMAEAMKGVKNMFADKGAKTHYRVYRSGFGNMENYFMVAVAAKDGAHFETRSDENDALLGEERHAVFGKVMQYVTSMEEITGQMRPDLAYSPTK